MHGDSEENPKPAPMKFSGLCNFDGAGERPLPHLSYLRNFSEHCRLGFSHTDQQERAVVTVSTRVPIQRITYVYFPDEIYAQGSI